jgi:hypothetical protein
MPFPPGYCRLYFRIHYIILIHHVLKAACMKTTGLWGIARCSLVEIGRRFRGESCSIMKSLPVALGSDAPHHLIFHHYQSVFFRFNDRRSFTAIQND